MLFSSEAFFPALPPLFFPLLWLPFAISAASALAEGFFERLDLGSSRAAGAHRLRFVPAVSADTSSAPEGSLRDAGQIVKEGVRSGVGKINCGVGLMGLGVGTGGMAEGVKGMDSAVTDVEIPSPPLFRRLGSICESQICVNDTLLVTGKADDVTVDSDEVDVITLALVGDDVAAVVVCDDVAVVPDAVGVCSTGVCGGASEGSTLMSLLKEVSLSMLGVRVSPAAMRLRRSLASSRVIVTNLHIFPSTASARASRASIPPFRSLGFSQSL